MEAMLTRALTAGTVNEEQRTIEVTFATETPVRSFRWSIGEFDEILSMKPEHVRMQRLEGGAPVLDNHDRWNGTRSVLGKVENPVLDGSVGRATLRFSKRKDVEEGVWQDVKDKILTGISVGYRVYKYEEVNPDRKQGELPILRAIDWEPTEVSLAPVQADPNSRVRSEKSDEMEVEIIAIAGVKDPEPDPVIENNRNTNTMSDPQNKPNTPEGGAPAPVDMEKVRTDAIAAERKRVSDIHEAVRKAKLSEDFALELVANGKTIDEARAAIIEKFASEDPNKGQRNTVSVGADETDKRRKAMENALILRANPNFKLTDEERSSARDFRGMSLIRMSEEAIRAAGGSTKGLSEREIAVAALGIDDQSVRAAGLHTNSDFPIILGNTINRVLRAEYALAESTFAPWTRQTTARDFREMTKAQFGEVGNFAEVVEGSEYKSTTLSEAKESYRIKKYGQMINVSWEALINDDLGAFSRVPSKIAAAANRLKSDIIYNILTSNPTMGDGVALFHSTHGNLAASGGAIDITTLGAGRKAMRNQKGLDKKDFLNLSPSFLLVGPDYEQLALQYTSASYVPDVPNNINPWRGLLQVIVEPRLTGNQWYLITNPGIVETIEYAYLEGEGELYTETKQGFEVDGVQVKARMTFGAKAIDFRGMYKNAGA